jgi:hypothetical protein
MRNSHRANWSVILFMAAMTGAGDAAQSKPSPEQPARHGSDIGRTVTLRGCLKSWDGTTTGVGRDEAGTALRYVLTGVEHGAGVVPPAATGTSRAGVPSSPAPRVAHDTYVVQAEKNTRLSQYVNRQVEVIGTLEIVPPHDASTRDPKSPDKPKEPGQPLSTAPPPPGVTPAPEQTAAVPVQVQRVLATSVTTISEKCP